MTVVLVVGMAGWLYRLMATSLVLRLIAWLVICLINFWMVRMIVFGWLNVWMAGLADVWLADSPIHLLDGSLHRYTNR